MTDLVERRYLIVKRGLYYRPDNKGYTAIKSEAGRYLKSDAIDGVNYAVHEDEAGDFSPSAWEATKIAHLSDRITALEAEIARKDALMEKTVQAGLDAAEAWLKSTKNKINVTNWTDFNDPNRLTYVALEQAEFAISAMSASEIVKEMCGE